MAAYPFAEPSPSTGNQRLSAAAPHLNHRESSAAPLAELSARLAALMARIAQEFMALAAALQANSQRARQIAAASHHATGAETIEHSTRSIAVLKGMLNDSAGVTKLVEIGTDTMSEILSHVKSVDAPLHRLTKMSTLLQMVSVLCRIEGGRVASGLVDIENLSKDIDRLAAEVEQHIDGILSDSSILSALLHEGLAELSRFGEQERLSANNLIERTHALLGPALERADSARSAALSIDEQYIGFHRATDDVVMSLQSEDLARERLEHVQEALHRSAVRLDDGEDPVSVAGILILQRAQIASTRDILATAADAIHAGLESLAPRIQQLVSETATLALQTEEDGHAFATLIETGLETFADVFHRCSSSAVAVVSLVNSVLPSVQQMTGRACALEEIELSVRLISLNATVKTTQLGPEGATMGVLAAQLHTITRERGGDTAHVLEGLAAISEALVRITQERDPHPGLIHPLDGQRRLHARRAHRPRPGHPPRRQTHRPQPR